MDRLEAMTIANDALCGIVGKKRINAKAPKWYTKVVPRYTNKGVIGSAKVHGEPDGNATGVVEGRG